MDIPASSLRAKVPFFFKQWGGVHVYLLLWAGRRSGQVERSRATCGMRCWSMW
jgi:protein gp37